MREQQSSQESSEPQEHSVPQEPSKPQEPSDSQGRTERVELGNGRYKISEYDSAGKVVKETYYNADDSISVGYAYEYDSAGKTTKVTFYDADGNKIQ